MIDLHCHILFGLDDGPATLEESVEFARALVSHGIRSAAATPHVRDDYRTTSEIMEECLRALQAELSRRSIPLDLRPGGEVAMEQVDQLSAVDRRAFGLGGNPSYLLLEFPYSGWPLPLPELAARLLRDGVTPVLAHPERNLDVQADPGRLSELVAAGVLVQLTAASVAGRFGRTTRSTALRLVELGLVHLVSTDAHNPGQRLAAIAGVAPAIADAELTRWLTRDVPQSILDREQVPDRPSSAGTSWQRVLRKTPRR